MSAKDKIVKSWRLDCCKDGTISIRRSNQPSFNGAALPVYWTDTEKMAKAIQMTTCRRSYEPREQPMMFSWGCIDGKLGQLERVAAVFERFEKEGVKAAYDLAMQLDEEMKNGNQLQRL